MQMNECVSPLKGAKLLHIRWAREGELRVDGGMTETAFCGAEVVWDVDELAVLDASHCVGCATVVRQLLLDAQEAARV